MGGGLCKNKLAVRAKQRKHSFSITMANGKEAPSKIKDRQMTINTINNSTTLLPSSTHK